jgi:nucleoside-diphosphate-sugar epimerase
MYTNQNWSDDSSPVVVLGGSGFIGTRLVRILLQQGLRVRIGDVYKSADFPELWQACDVRDPLTLAPLIHGASAVINLAAEHRDDVRPISRYQETNVDGAKHVCEAAREAKVKKIIFTSSVAVYGFHSRPIDESGPFEPANLYGMTKLEAERIYKAWSSEDPARTLVIIRPTVVFGENNRGNVHNLLRQIAIGRFFMVGSGRNVKSMAYVGNVAEFLHYSLSFGPGESVFNYADGPDMSTQEIVALVRTSLGRSPRTPSVPLSIALPGAYALDVLARLTGKSFPVSAIRVRKFCETTQFLADRVSASGFVRPYSLSDALLRTIQYEFPQKLLASRKAVSEDATQSDLNAMDARR